MLAPVVVIRRPDTAADHPDQSERRVRVSWALFGATFFLLAAVAVRQVLDVPGPIQYLGLALLALLGVAAIVTGLTSAARDANRQADLEDLARILHGFSRAESPDEIVDAILRELGRGTGADHVVVVRRRRGAPILDATLVSMRAGEPTSSALLPAIDLDGPGDVILDRWAGVPVGPGRPRTIPGDEPGSEDGGGDLAGAERAAERVERRVRHSFGLKHTLSVPLFARDAVIGAIVISRRRPEPWPDAARRLLEVASLEAAAALTRAYSQRDSLRDAEARATTDTLTGLPNRRYFEEYVDLLSRGRRADDAVGILMIDIDRFKTVNDRHGHAVGDVVLREVGQAITRAVRDVDVPARFGGEEFVVLLRNPSPEIAHEVGERIRSAVARLDLQKVGVEGVTVSVGSTIARRVDEPVAVLIERADHALYRAKRHGRNRVEAA
jgi:diguanylate cyclase (GGDEF)-like protein